MHAHLDLCLLRRFFTKRILNPLPQPKQKPNKTYTTKLFNMLNHLQTLLTTLPLTLALTLPRPLDPRQHAAIPLNTTITHYQTPHCSLQPVISGQLTLSSCQPLLVQSIALGQVECAQCTFVVYYGTANCRAGEASEVVEWELGKEKGETCVDVDVFAGGRWREVSGWLNCI